MSETPVTAPAAATPATPAAPVAPKVMKHELQPEWGLGFIMEDAPKHWVIFFEKAGLKKFIKDKAKVLVPVTVTDAQLASLKSKASGRSKPRPQSSAGAAKSKKTAPKARFKTFAAQLEAFEKLFPGGFMGEAFTTGERASKDAAIALAQSELSKQAFATATPEVLFESARKLLKATNIVFPIEGAIPFGTMEADQRGRALEGLKELLHGEGDYGDRVEKFAASVSLKDKSGPKTVTWPFATVFGALFDPAQYACVKPTAFATQALTLGVPLEKSQPVTALGYQQFSGITKRTQDQLKAAGKTPRDLMDVYSFIHRTHAEKPAEKPAV